ncbi:hypothetical protein ACQCX2_11255 [Propionibacteriaceae bacterium Y1700]|uniref:hypothetical protein n=1 Tax=Microlunatus sp. Y1700 TaxID=3418487 RepID=UPI003DA6E227
MSVSIDTDLDHGGRWTSLVGGGREWLWQNPDPAISAARPTAGAQFVDAGGGEECFPTVRGEPDHGALWGLRWSGTPQQATVDHDGWSVSRSIEHGVVDHLITGEPGRPFVHAMHLLLDLGPTARILLPDQPEARVLGADDGDDLYGTWPVIGGVDLSRLGPGDGTATCAVLPGVTTCTIVDGHDQLHLRWRRIAGAGAGEGLILWRNLYGWPDPPYRSIGVEPMLGHTADHSESALAARLDAEGRASWRLEVSTPPVEVSAGRRSGAGWSAPRTGDPIAFEHPTRATPRRTSQE